MKKYKIKESSGHPYININHDAIHTEAVNQKDGQRGDIVLEAINKDGTSTPLGFYKQELEEVK
jgi:hypothetical protein